MAVTRLNDFHAAPGKEIALRDFLRAVIALIESAPGCLAVELLLDQEDRAHFVIVERWTGVAAHRAAASRVPAEKMSEVRPLLAAPPTGRYYDPSASVH
jgi:quinol monooxygenase YgiN